MERARQRKSKSASGIEGIQQIHKAVSRLSTNSRPCIDEGKREGMYTLELGQSFSRGATGIPMKKLLAEEMSKEIEPKRRSPSVIARLMGLEGLPSPRPVHGQQKRLSPDSYQHNNASANIKSKSQRYDPRRNRSPMDHPEFKDVYEDLEASHIVNRRCSSRWSASSILTKPELALIQHKFIDAIRLSTDEKLQDWQPDSVKHLHDKQQVDSGNTLDSHIEVLKPLNPEKYESKAEAWRSGREYLSKFHVTSHLKREDGFLLEPHNRHRDHVPRSSSRTEIEPTRIVVLKPNLGKMQNTGPSSSIPSLNLSGGYNPIVKKNNEYPGVVEGMSCGRKDLFRDVGLSKPISKEAREIAKKITIRLRDGYDETMDARSIGHKGYIGDESSNDANGSDSDSESEVFRLSFRKLLDDNKLRKSSVNREARNRLSERWKMTHKYQDLEVVRKGSTLGEMLALPDRETRFYYAKTSLGKESDHRLGGNNGTVVRDCPLGISSRDGWMDEIITRNSRRSKSLPPSSGGKDRSHRRSIYFDELAEDKKLMHGQTIHCGRSKPVKRNSSHKEDCSSTYSQYRGKKPQHCQEIFIEEMDSSLEANFEIQMEANIKDLSEQHSVFEMSAKADTCKSFVVDVRMISEPGSITLSSAPPEVIQKHSSSVIDGAKSAAQEQEDCSFQELNNVPFKQGSPSLPSYIRAEMEFSESSREAGHPSPISVLQVPFTEDTSSSESFERVSAELQELRLQLQLLKMESSTDADMSALFPIEEEEEDNTQPSPLVSEGNYVLDWEIFYALDVLITSGLQDSDSNMFRTLWYSPDCPLDPNLFENIEKKYSHDETIGVRSERRLIFDRINSALLQIFVEHVDLGPWVMPKLAGLNSKWQRQCVRDAVVEIIEKELSGIEIISDKAVDREMQWSDSRGEIEIIGNEIQELLIDDIITEVLRMTVCK
ncbi:hypothetical protein OROGR_024158 [Orobanche gracilis]